MSMTPDGPNSIRHKTSLSQTIPACETIKVIWYGKFRTITDKKRDQSRGVYWVKKENKSCAFFKNK